MTLGRALHRRRIDHHRHTAVQAAVALGVSRATIENWELDRVEPRDHYLAAIGDYLGISAEEVEHLRDNPNQKEESP